MTSTVLSEDDVEWMRQLQWQVWDKPRTAGRFNRRAPPPQPTLKRALTTEEWKRVCSAIEAHKLPCTIINVNFAFGIGIAIYGHSPIPEEKPPFLLTVSYEQLPEAPTEVRALWEHAWRLFERMVRAKRNLEVLDFYRMEHPKDRQHYEY